MTRSVRLWILLGAGLVLIALCVYVALRAVRNTRTATTRAEQVALATRPVVVVPAAVESTPRHMPTVTPQEQPSPRSDTDRQQHEAVLRGPVRPERVINICTTRWRRPSAFHDGWGSDSFYLSERDIKRVGSLERALKGIPGVVVR
ncbi:hypothetical protein JXD38_10605 [candidate division WOR-3 bacterium]|nr:hypothetical protein [candidate division WOR-3 bacterium]